MVSVELTHLCNHLLHCSHQVSLKMNDFFVLVGEYFKRKCNVFLKLEYREFRFEARHDITFDGGVVCFHY